MLINTFIAFLFTNLIGGPSTYKNDFPSIYIDSTASNLNFTVSKSYCREKRFTLALRDSLKEQYFQLNDSLEKDTFLDSVSIVFSSTLLNNIIPHWYGTSWDFNGYTNVPNQGEIACGYFVSTTLKHMGLNINRYDLAKQNPLNEAKSVAIDTNCIVSVESENIKMTFFESFKSGLYFVGLDGHVGYLYVNNEKAFFLHSNYLENRVMLETIQNSEAFISYSYSISKITGNKILMLKWLLGDKVSVFKFI